MTKNKKFDSAFKVITFLTFAYIIINTFMWYVDSGSFHLYMSWNLFLAWVPLLFSKILKNICTKREKPKAYIFVILLLGVLWLLFYPNSPYIITDYIHISSDFEILKDIPIEGIYPEITQRIYVFNDDFTIWLDFVVISIGVWLGYITGFVSLKSNELLIKERTNKVVSAFFVAIIHILTGYAITIGRFGRWNSWDVFLPSNIIEIVTSHFDVKTLMFTILFGALNAALYSFISLAMGSFTEEESI